MANPSHRHHYIPQFYQRPWTGPDGKLTVFIVQPHGLVARRKTPAQTGWHKELYSSAEVSAAQPDQLEARFMGPLDSVAAEVTKIFVSQVGVAELDQRQRDGWTRFLMSLMHRSPERVATLRAQFTETLEKTSVEIDDEARRDYARDRQADWPADVEGYLEATKERAIEFGTLNVLRLLSDSEKIGTHINSMTQTVITLPLAQPRLLTSDQPLILSSGLGDPKTFIMLPISPRHLYIATNSVERMAEIKGHIDSGAVALESNVSVCRNAQRYVSGSDEGEIGFVRQHFGKSADVG